MKNHLLLFLLSIPLYGSSQNPMPNSLGDCKSVKRIEHGVLISTTNGNCRVMVYSPSVLRVTISKGNSFRDFSYAVITASSADKFTVSETADQLTLATDSVQLLISKKPVRLSLYTKQGKLINADDQKFGTSWVGEEVTTYKKLFPGERFIGLGEKTGGLDRRGSGYTNWNTDAYGYGENADPIYSTIPFYIGLHDSLAYGIFFDNSFKTNFNFGASNERFSSFSADAGEMDYYLIYRSSVPGIIESYTQLTGRMELPPLWALGFQQCRYSYFPEAQVLNIAQTFRDKKIPCDVIYLDIHYMDQYKLFTWNKERFPDPKGMLTKLENQHFKVVTIIDPGVKDEAGYAPDEEGIKNNLFLKYPDGTNYRGQVWPGWCHFPDFTKPETRVWWGRQFKGLVDDGVDGFWNDMNEPATWGQKFPDNVLFDFDGKKSTHREGHNIFGFQMARSTFEGEKTLLNGKRPFTLTRAGYAGLQRYTAIWTGDNQPTDAHLLAGVRLVSSLGLSGVSFAGYDVSGFAGDATPELFARWISIGAFCPFFRSHKEYGCKSSEPWSYGESVEEISRSFIQLRYNLMPYIYSSFYESTVNGMPVQRSLAIDYTFDSNIYNGTYQNEYLFGSSILIAPCISTERITKVYLPEGKWYDLYSDKLYNGKSEVALNSSLEKLPVLIKAGSIIPMQSPVQSTADMPSDTLILQVYGGANGNYTYYEDAGNGYEYKNGAYCKRSFVYDETKKELYLEKQEGSYASQFKYLRIYFHGVDLNVVKVNGSTVAADPQAYYYMNGSATPAGLKSVAVKNSPDKINVSW